MWKNAVEQCGPQKTIWHMRIACWITKTTQTHTQSTQSHTLTHSKYVTLIAFPLQQWLQERASMLHYTYVVCSKSIRIGIVVVVHRVGCVCNQS